MLRSDYEICGAFLLHFRDLFARLLDLPVQEVRSIFADVYRLQEAEASGCEGLVTECKVRDALKQLGLNMSSGLDDLPYEVYSRISRMFVLILTDVFNHWFAHFCQHNQGSDHITEER